MTTIQVQTPAGGFAAHRDEPMKITPCTSCRTPIFFAKTAAGKWIPVDTNVSSDGKYTSHFATCPHAKKFRKR